MSSETAKTGKLIFPLTSSVKLLKQGFIYLIVILLSVVVLTQPAASNLLHLCAKNYAMILTLISAVALAVLVIQYSRRRIIYLLDFACYKPSPANLSSKEDFMRVSLSTGEFTEESLEFQRKILEKSGFGQMTYLPRRLLACKTPPDNSLESARDETQTAIFGAIDDLLEKSGVSVGEIGVLVVNSSLFNPTPSLSAMIVNRYKLREDVLSYNLGGMGCSAGLISLDLARDILQVHPHTYALIVSTENITSNWYFGNVRQMLLSNCLFRVGAAAVLLTNRHCDRHRSKYQLLHTVRTHKGAGDKSYACVFQQEDDRNIVGAYLSKDLMAVAGEALKTNITTLGPLVLPISEQILFLATLIAKKVLQLKVKPYIPDFKLAFEHFCIHAGGRGVLDEVEKRLKLTEWHMEPSRMTLYRFGNTSSSSLWYELAYSEAKARVKKGDRVWQIGFGSGFKCNSVVWRAVKSIESGKKKNVWWDEIDGFPVQVPKVAPIVY